MAKTTKATPHYRATRSEKITRGETTYDLVVGQVYDDLPDDLIELLCGKFTERPPHADGGVVYQNVDPAEGRHRGAHNAG